MARARVYAEAEPFSVEVEPERDVVRVIPIGELDLATVAQLDSQLQELRGAGFEQFVLDLRRLDFIDSSGLHLIIQLDTDARSNGHAFSVIPGPPAVQRLFDLTGIGEYLLVQPRVSADARDESLAEPNTDDGVVRGERPLERDFSDLGKRPQRTRRRSHGAHHRT